MPTRCTSPAGAPGRVGTLYNHATDLGALANDVGFALANTHAQRVREQLLRINDAVTGHRLLRGAIHPGGVRLRRPRPRELEAIGADLVDVAALTLANAASTTDSPAPRS